MGLLDRLIRLIIGLILVYIVFKGYFIGLIAIILGLIGLILIITAVIGYCPLYTVLKISTSKKK